MSVNLIQRSNSATLTCFDLKMIHCVRYGHSVYAFNIGLIRFGKNILIDFDQPKLIYEIRISILFYSILFELSHMNCIRFKWATDSLYSMIYTNEWIRK